MNTERSIDHIYLTQEQFSSLIREAFPNCPSLDKWQILSGGAVNSTYKFTVGKEDFVLRLYNRGHSHCKTEQDLHALVSATVLTPELIYSNEHQALWAYAIFRFAAGIHIYDVQGEYTVPLSRELGKTLASIHSFKFPEAGLIELRFINF